MILFNSKFIKHNNSFLFYKNKGKKNTLTWQQTVNLYTPPGTTEAVLEIFRHKTGCTVSK